MPVALLSVSVAGCDTGGPDYVTDAPLARVVQVLVTSGLDADGQRVREAVAGDGKTNATTTTSIGVVFDRYLDPRTAIRQSFCLQSTTEATPAGPEECVSGISLTPTYDPVTRTVTLYLGEPLSSTTHRLTVFAPRDEQDFGIRAFDSAALETAASFTFLADAALGELESPADLDEGIVECADAAALFVACHSCHADGSNSQPYDAPVDLSFQKLGLARAIDRVAHQTSLGDQGAEAASRPARFGAGMPVIERNNPGNSYAIYKVLARARYGGETMADGELERLQAWVVGSPMPANEESTPGESATITQGALRRISNWVASGARCELPDPPPTE